MDGIAGDGEHMEGKLQAGSTIEETNRMGNTVKGKVFFLLR